jgi:hypothetical protein
VTSFNVDPNVIIKEANTVCEDQEVPVASDVISPSSQLSPSCQVLETNNSNPEDYLNCLGETKALLKYKDSDSASKTLSKLYSLHPLQQKFMAYVLTLHGETSGVPNPVPHMAGVMKTIENRLAYAQKKYPQANELDVVLQNSQFSMYNSRDPNWRRVIKEKPEKMLAAITTYVKRKSFSIQLSPPSPKIDQIYHYATEACMLKYPPKWKDSSKHVKLVVDGRPLEIANSHMFYRNIAWAFNPKNIYKSYAEQEGLI